MSKNLKKAFEPEIRTIDGRDYEVCRPTDLTRAQRAVQLANMEVSIHNAKQTALPPADRLIQYPLPMPACITLKRLSVKMSEKTARRMLTKNPTKLAKEVARARA